VIYDTLNQSPTGLRTVGIAVGVWLVVSHGFALVKGDMVRDWLKKLPFSTLAGQVMLVIAGLWAFFLFKGLNLGFIRIPKMDLGEFFHLRPFLMILVPLTVFLVILYCEEFLAARALGCLLLLAAAIPLDAAFLKEPSSRLLLVVFAYAAILKGLFWVGMPYLLRDQVNWATATAGRWRLLCAGGLVYGVLILVSAVLWWGPSA
jgi:hypothetical protein